MDNSKKVGGSSSSSNSFDHLFGPRDSSSSTTSAGLFSTIFPPPSAMRGRNSHPGNQVGSSKYGASGNMSKDVNKGTTSKDKKSIHQNESAEPSYLSSSIYYGGQENYSPITKCSESNQYFKKNGKGDDDQDDNNSDSASRGNWWQGSLYY